MKKTLKVIASAAVAMSAFASVAMADDAATTSSTTTTDSSATATTTATKTSADFKDLANVDAALKAKIDALLKAGVFEGVSDDSFGIDENMTRAQFAKVLDLIYGVNVDMSVKSSSFSDVKADDQANGWAIPYIEAAKKAGLIDGVSDTTFVPGDNVTLGQFATALVKGLGVKPDMTGTPWYADAVKQAVAKNVLPADTDGSKLATRADLVVGAYGGQQAYNEQNKPAQVSVASVKATGVKTVQVTLDRDVDTSKATLALTFAGNAAVTTTTKWSDDKKSATLTLTQTTLHAGDYTVTLGGLDAADIKTATGTFTAQDEVVQKIEFVTSSDTIAKSKNVQVKLKATNQYGELASASAGNYNTYGAVKLTKNADGYLLATVDTSSAASGVGIVTVTVINNDSHVTVTKNFTVGTEPILSKIDLGAAQYSNSASAGLNGTGDNVKFALNLYDQYGSMMGYDALNIGSTNELKPTVIWNDYLDGANAVTEDDGNNNPVLKISLTKNVDKSGDYNFTVIDQAASATGKISIKSAKVATKVQIGAMDNVIAAGDADAYIPVIAYDAQGNQLTADELVSDDNYDRITVSSSSSSKTRLMKSGEHKGQIYLDNIPETKNGAVSVSVFIATANVSSSDTKTYTVQAARIPDHINAATSPASQLAINGYTKFKYQVIDQYGKKLDSFQNVDSQGNVSSSGSKYSLTVTAVTYQANYDPADTAHKTITGYTDVGVTTATSLAAGKLIITGDKDLNDTDNTASDAKALLAGKQQPITDIKTFNGKTYRFFADANSNSDYKLEFALQLMKDNNDGKGAFEISRVAKTITIAKADADLTYKLNTVAALWNAKDSEIVRETTYDGTNTLSKDAQLQANSKFGREVTVSATNAAGETVGLPKQITAISSSNTVVANVYIDSKTGKAWVIGNKAGTASVLVSFRTPDNTVKTLNTDVTVKNDPLTVANVTWDDKGYNEDFSFLAFQNLNIYDNYGVNYENGDGQKYNYALGVTFGVKITESDDPNATVTLDPYGQVTVSSTKPVTFELTATSATGKSATTTIYATDQSGNPDGTGNTGTHRSVK